jgi:hypothetical protein
LLLRPTKSQRSFASTNSSPKSVGTENQLHEPMFAD